MSDKRKHIATIVDNLKKVNPLKVVLFGSYANDHFSEESDLDLLVVLDSSEIPKSYDEKMKNRMMVRDTIYELSKKIAIDLLVFTGAEYAVLAEHRSAFFNQISETGRVLYENPV
jgi:predicted nucleotidyltransferase